MREEVVIKLEQGEGKDVYFRLGGRVDNREPENIHLFISQEVIKPLVTKVAPQTTLPGATREELHKGWGNIYLLYGEKIYRFDAIGISPPEGGGSVLPEAKRLFALFVSNWEVALTDHANNHKGYKPYTLK